MEDVTLREILAKNLRRELSTRHMTQVELARRAGIKQPHIAAILAEKYATTVDTIDRVAGALDIPAAQLLLPAQEFSTSVP